MFRQKQGVKINPVRGNYNQKHEESNRLFPVTAELPKYWVHKGVRPAINIFWDSFLSSIITFRLICIVDQQI